VLELLLTLAVLLLTVAVWLQGVVQIAVFSGNTGERRPPAHDGEKANDQRA
jgi:hypothetical protein